MQSKRTSRLAALTLSAILPGAQAAAQTPTLEELWAIVQQQQEEIADLKAELAGTQNDVAEADARIAATGDVVETLAIDSTTVSATTIGGYGELHYNNVDSDAGDSDEVDFHRFVLFFGHDFSERIRFFSELELEHSIAADGEPGEVELEQAYLDFALNENLSAKTGLFLLPVGILNETHEPNTFYGVERNDVENVILPATWWEAGAALSGHWSSGLSWDAAIHSGLAMPTDGGSAFRVRSGRQKVAEAVASDPAYTLRVRYTGVPGLELAASYQYQSDPSQLPGDGLDSGQLFTAHAAYARDGFGLRALYGLWNFDGFAVEAAGADRQEGWYVEPSYRLNEQWGFYARYEDLDGAREIDRFTQSEIGFNYWPLPGVVLKLDLRDRAHAIGSLAAEDFVALDLGLGYAF